MKRLAVVMCASLMVLSTVAVTSAGTVWNESLLGAGKTLATAEETSGSGALEEIVGSTDTVDMYKIKAAGTSLTAWETNGSDPFQLFLFDSSGAGVKASALGAGGTDPLNGGPASGAVALIATGLTAGAHYFLAIAANFFEPVDAFPMLMFDSLGDPAAGAGVLDGWTDGFASDPPFSIGLLNVSPAIELETQVPEPGTLLLIGTGLVGLGVAARRRRHQ